MHHLLHLPASLTLLTLCRALPHGNPPPPPTPTTPPSSSSSFEDSTSTKSSPLPLLIWHGLGDRFDAEGLQSTGELAQQAHPGTYVYYIHTDEDGSADRTNTFFGNISAQIEDVCGLLRNDTRLHASRTYLDNYYKNHEQDGEEDGGYPILRVDALGFSQGGQFLRGLLQRCEGLHVRSLVTFGSQHNGIAKFQDCGTWDLVCKAATALVQGNVWTDTIQGKVVPAQYFRETNGSYSLSPEEEEEEDGEVTGAWYVHDLVGLSSKDVRKKREREGRPDEAYLNHSHFLADINNERTNKSTIYKERLSRLSHFIMYVFEDDTTVIPKESGWFADVNLTSGHVTSLRDRRLYKEDWLGLRTLDEKGALMFASMKGGHMRLDEDVLRGTFEEYFGPEEKLNRQEIWEELMKEAEIMRQTTRMLPPLTPVSRCSRRPLPPPSRTSWTWRSLLRLGVAPIVRLSDSAEGDENSFHSGL